MSVTRNANADMNSNIDTMSISTTAGDAYGALRWFLDERLAGQLDFLAELLVAVTA